MQIFFKFITLLFSFVYSFSAIAENTNSNNIFKAKSHLQKYERKKSDCEKIQDENEKQDCLDEAAAKYKKNTKDKSMNDNNSIQINK